MTQEELAEELKVSRQAISKWEVGASKPDVENIVKISKLFSITIDELVNNQIIKTDAISVDIKSDDKRREVMIWLRRFMILMIAFLILSTIYKFVMLFRITSVEKQYMELSNYHYVITTYKDYNSYEEEECWFKDGVSKTVNTAYNDSKIEKKITSIDYNNKYGYVEDNTYNERMEIDVQEYLLRNQGFEKGMQLYLKFPQNIKQKNPFKIFWKCLDSSDINISLYDNNIMLQVENNFMNLQNKTLLPIMDHYKNEYTEEYNTVQYKIELNSVESIEI